MYKCILHTHLKLWAGWELKKIKVNCTFITFNSLLLRSNGQYPFTKKNLNPNPDVRKVRVSFHFFKYLRSFFSACASLRVTLNRGHRR